MRFQRLKGTSMLPIVGTTSRWTSGRPSSIFRRGALQRGAALTCTTTLMGATISPRRVHSYRNRYFDFTSTTRPDESFTKCAPHCRQTSPGTRLAMPTTTQPTKRSETSSVWTHSRGKAIREQPGDTMAGQRAWLLHGPLRSSPSELPEAVGRR